MARISAKEAQAILDQEAAEQEAAREAALKSTNAIIVRVSMSDKNGKSMNKDNLFRALGSLAGFQGTVALGDHTLDEEALEAMGRNYPVVIRMSKDSQIDFLDAEKEIASRVINFTIPCDAVEMSIGLDGDNQIEVMCNEILVAAAAPMEGLAVPKERKALIDQLRATGARKAEQAAQVNQVRRDARRNVRTNSVATEAVQSAGVEVTAGLPPAV